MALQKKLDYGFSGYEVPPIPRAARSARRRCIFQSKTDDHQLGAFDLLATVADKLLMEGGISPKPVDMYSGKEQQTVVAGSITEEQAKYKPLIAKSCDLDVCDQSSLFTEQVSEAPVSNFCSNELTSLQNEPCSLPASVITSECSRKLADDECKLGLGIIAQKLDVRSSGCRMSAGCRLDGESEKQIKMESKVYRNLSISSRDDMCSPGCPETWESKQSALVRSPNSIKFPSCRGHMSFGSFPFNSEGVKIVTRDNEEKSRRCTQPTNANTAIRPLSDGGDWRIKKSLASKHCKATSNLKGEGYNANKKRCSFLNTKNRYRRQISQRDYPFKKRKLFYCCSARNSDVLINSDGICSFSENDSKGAALLPGPASPGAGECSPFQSRNSHVKLKIKSFRVPDLFIELPETATVGSLKRTVMKAVTSILGDGLHVGMLLQGKKIKDDNRTLLQTGISRDNKSDALGFTLEPTTQTFPTHCPEDPFQLPRDSPQPRARSPLIANVVQDAVEQKSLDALTDPAGGNFRNFPESDDDSALSTPDMLLEKTPTGSRALVAAPKMREALAIVPMHISKQSESAQRRMRRPFTVSEVEALVQAVEKLGTGRWRDVKLRAFDNAKHRTYVDLKDKWKTLVHTARISPEQRRGEPVPQELLDRVLTAHAYWSEQQTKYQLKSQRESCLV
ncbi:telomere repeat-binding protein 5-like isoform X2 [Olea europaea var. sylvestris]|uniref:telomere repeat-binding protein 5-like isoform X2 n=1 Tax=Olea europaea var. sylvestris TaxID=158386 RepID=UPI000C1CF1BA|nr:telomere repeat-binding protein 5-like isoform X2 [Olea europaea var. sylvestris]